MVILTVARKNRSSGIRDTKKIVAFRGVKAAMKELEELRLYNDMTLYESWEIDTLDDTSELTEEMVLKQGVCKVKVFAGNFLDGVYKCDKISAVKGRIFLYRNNSYITSFPDTQAFDLEEGL